MCYPHSIDEEFEAQRTCPRSQTPNCLHSMLTLSAFVFATLISQPLARRFAEENNRTKEEDILADPCHILANGWRRLPAARGANQLESGVSSTSSVPGAGSA